VKELLGARRLDDPLAALSDREREVLALMAEGRSNIGIARALWVTATTVRKHVQHILTKRPSPDVKHHPRPKRHASGGTRHAGRHPGYQPRHITADCGDLEAVRRAITASTSVATDVMADA
jgi:DNA-binding CsgD family transcriptional regulator